MFFDLPEVKEKEIVAVDVRLIDGTIDSYDPVVELKIENHALVIDNTFHTYEIGRSDFVSFTIYTRKQVYHADIDVFEYIDNDPCYFWENTE